MPNKPTLIPYKRLFLSFLHAFAIILILVTAAGAEEEKPTMDATVSALSQYVWRGQEQTKGVWSFNPP